MPMCYFNIDHDIVNIRRVAADVASLLVMPRRSDNGEDHHNSVAYIHIRGAR